MLELNCSATALIEYTSQKACPPTACTLSGLGWMHHVGLRCNNMIKGAGHAPRDPRGGGGGGFMPYARQTNESIQC